MENIFCTLLFLTVLIFVCLIAYLIIKAGISYANFFIESICKRIKLIFSRIKLRKLKFSRCFRGCKKIACFIISLVISPTWWFAKCVKSKCNPYVKGERSRVIKSLNCFYLLLSSTCILIILYLQECYFDPENISLYCILSCSLWLVCACGWISFSRCNEIFYAFYVDAQEKLKSPDCGKSNLKPHERVRLALNSYLELILNFAILYALTPMSSEFWSQGKGLGSESVLGPERIIDAIYYSGVTITTLGYGDYSPVHWTNRFLAVYEVLCGFMLLIVSFGIYTGLGKEASK